MQTANSWTRDGVTGNNYLANGGTELNTASNLYDLMYRNYDPVLGRMNQVDPAVDNYSSLTPYNFSFNNPVAFNDPLGDSPIRREGGNLVIDIDLVEEMGGSWSNTGGDGTWTTFTNPEQAFAFGLAYNNYHDSWANTEFGTEQGSILAYLWYNSTGQMPLLETVEFNSMPANHRRYQGVVVGMLKKYTYGSLTLTLEGLQQYLAIVAGESTDNRREAAGIGSVIINRLMHAKSEMSGDLVAKLGGVRQFNAIGKSIYNEIMALPLSAISQMLQNPFEIGGKYSSRFEGAMLPILFQEDFSGGAYFFNATGQKYEDDIGDNWRAYNKGTYTITTSQGGTTFFRYTDASKTFP